MRHRKFRKQGRDDLENKTSQPLRREVLSPFRIIRPPSGDARIPVPRHFDPGWTPWVTHGPGSTANLGDNGSYLSGTGLDTAGHGLRPTTLFCVAIPSPSV